MLSQSPKVGILVCLFILIRCSDVTDDIQPIQQFSVFDFIINSAEHTPDDFYILNCTDRMVKLSPTGKIVWTKMHSLFLDTLPTGVFRITQSITNSSETIILGSLLHDSTVNLLCYKLDSDGNFLTSNRYIISNHNQAKLPRSNEEFYILDNHYPLGQVSNSGDLFIAFSFDEKSNERAKYAMIKIDETGTLKTKKIFDMGDFYGRIYNVMVSSSESIVITRGGRDWMAYDIYSSEFNLIEGQRFMEDVHTSNLPDKFGDPILNGIHEISPDHFIFTGHIDLLNNPNLNFITNFDFFIVDSEADSVFQSVGQAEYKELAFSSFDASDGNLCMIGTRRGFNELIQDVDSDLVLLTRNPSGEFSEQVIVKNQGMEGLFACENADHSITVLGVKTGFTNDIFQSFLIRYNPSP